jgi:hypothetical protein
MVCGDLATRRKQQVFTPRPAWVVWLLPIAFYFSGGLVLLLLLFERRRTLNVPVCDIHGSHWFWRTVLLFAGLCGLVVLFLAWMAAEPGPRALARGAKDDLSFLLVLVWYLLLPCWAVLYYALQLTAVRACRLTASSLTLTGVAPAFAAGVDAERRLSAPDPAP